MASRKQATEAVFTAQDVFDALKVMFPGATTIRVFMQGERTEICASTGDEEHGASRPIPTIR